MWYGRERCTRPRLTGLVALPLGIGAVGDGAECGYAAIGEQIAAEFADAFAPQQQPERAAHERAFAEIAVQAAQCALHGVAEAAGLAAVAGIQQRPAAFEQLIQE
jgi:hypothetical protein